MRERNNNNSEFTSISYFIIILATGVQLFLWIMHFQERGDYVEYFSYIALIEGCFGLVGLLFLDLIRGHGFHIKPDRYKKLHIDFLYHTAIIFGGILLIQLFVAFIPLTVKDWEIALSIMFAAPCEEVFFRAFLISSSIEISEFSPKLSRSSITLFGKNLNYFTITGVIISALAFAGIHINYYGNPNMLLGVFLGGLWLGFTYWFWNDLTASILAHFILNFIVVYQTFWMVFF